MLGASIAGLVAARVLGDHYDRVTIIDRDEIPTAPDNRPGVPQGRHVHGILARGREIAELLFPGTTDDLVARGARLVDPHADGRWHPVGRPPLASGRSDLRMLLVSRPLLEWYLRGRLLADSRHTVVPESSVLDLAFSADQRRVLGAIVRDRDGGTPRLVPADLVVDATGRTSRTPEWLERRGYPTPPEEVRRADKSYVTRWFGRPDDSYPPVVAVFATSQCQRSGIVLAQEDDRYVVSVVGLNGDRPPLELADFRAYARSLASPVIADIVDHLRPLDDGARYRFPASRRRRYERVDRFPDGLVVTGDALCAFDPVYGQGMSAAAMEAVELGRCLTDGRSDLARRFHEAAARVIDNPWTIAVGVAPDSDGKVPIAARVANQYLVRYLRAATVDPQLALGFLRVNHLTAAPASLMRPRRLLAVAASTVRTTPRMYQPSAPRALPDHAS